MEDANLAVIKDVFWRMHLNLDDFTIVPDGDNYLVAVTHFLQESSIHTLLESPLKLLKVEAFDNKLIFSITIKKSTTLR